ncbi:S24 family peptidase [Sphingomonas aracearum]|uniref:S24 family peptidase n=1 Tax=Sphingomonas aracearum TaxID=2283317 RepID=A0A369VV70_9SPHN|nr:S24 family peptidase [Sphingomonas aracearum]RDE05467.1 S24 family peptidase [Sphingomonas aracearum]
MEMADSRATLLALAEEHGETLAALSRLIGRNEAYLQQFVRRGTPRRLADADITRLSRYFGVSEAELSGAAVVPPLPVVPARRLDVAAAAGSGSWVEEERQLGEVQFDRGMLGQLGVATRRLALVTARGESMLPAIRDGDQVLVDEGDTGVPAAGAVFVLRLDGVVMVKRVQRLGDRLLLSSDNPDYPAIPARRVEEVTVLGRAVAITRRL